MADAAGDAVSGSAALLKFTLIAKSAKGKGAVAVIQQALQSPATFVFGELLDLPNIKALAEGENKPWYDTLALFAYGTFADYKASPQSFGDLSPLLQKKLKQLSIVSLASSQKSLPYSLLLAQLDIGNVRELEDLVIESIYAGIIKGKLDQKEQRFQVDWTMGRDIRPGQLQEMLKILNLWCDKSETLMGEIKERIQYANLSHEEHQKQTKEFEQRVEDIKTNLKLSMEGEMATGDFADVDYSSFDSANKKSGRGKVKGPGQLDRMRRR
jgi:COP9 signalosome complex subunit 7